MFYFFSCVFQAKVPGDEWKELVLEATTEALKLGPSPVALLVQALLHFATKMGARWEPLLHSSEWLAMSQLSPSSQSVDLFTSLPVTSFQVRNQEYGENSH